MDIAQCRVVTEECRMQREEQRSKFKGQSEEYGVKSAACTVWSAK
jgi:hypothetical protein